MNLNITKTIELSKDDVKQAVREFLKNQGLEVVEDFDFNIRKHQWTEGIGSMEMDYEKLMFEGVKVKVK